MLYNFYMEKNLNLLIISTNPKDTYLNKVIFELNLFFNTKIKFITSKIMLKDLYDSYDLVIFDDTSIEEIKELNLFYIRMISRFTKFLYLTNYVSEEIEDDLYSSSIDFIIRKNILLTKVPPILSHCINLILHQKNNYKKIYIGPYEVNVIEKKITVNNKDVTLSSKEFLLLFFLHVNQTRYITRDEIFKNVWNYDDKDSSRLVDQVVASVRKITSHNFIITKNNVGYKLNVALE